MAAMPPLSLALFGTFTATLGAQSLRLPTDKTRALLAYLALAPAAPLRREFLAGLLWPEQTEALARQNLRKTLARLKQALAERAPAFANRLLTLTKQTIELNAGLCAVDAASFRAHLEAVRHHQHPGADLCEPCLGHLEGAIDLYRQGEFLAGFSLPDAMPFEEWLLMQRENLHRLQLTALQQLTTAYEQQGALEKARHYALWHIQEEPWREEAHRQLMRLLAAQGQRAEAIAQYQVCRRLLEAELGVAPSAETEALLTQIMDGALPVAATRPTTNRAQAWPQLAGPLIGREADLDRVIGLLAQPVCRVLTLTGLGGVGKTSLAIAVGERLRQAPPAWLPEGLYFVPLAAISNASLLPAAIAEAVGLELNQRQSVSAQVEQYVRSKALLLVMDNFEQLALEADWLRGLVATTSQLKVLITSREPLNWQGEWRYPLEGLAYPPDEADGREFDSVRLFVQAARQVQPGFAFTPENGADIGRICRLVYGWPLALQMAAAWVRMMSCAAIVDQLRRSLDFLTTSLRDVPPRQRSMRVIFEHTWASLTGEERRILAPLAVFRGGFTLAAAVEVAATSPWLLSGLVDKSLVRHDDRTHRYSMHELLRQFVREHLAADAATAEAAQRAHGRYYLGLLQAQGERLHTIHFRSALEVIHADLDNLRQAWLWAAGGHAHALLADSLGPMAKFYASSGLPQEAVALLQRTLAVLAEAGAPPAASLSAHIHFHLAESLLSMGQYREATAAVSAARQLAQAHADRELITHLFFIQASIYREQGRYDQSHAILAEAIAFSQDHHNLEGVARALHIQGNTYWSMAAYDQARHSYEQGRQLYQQLGLTQPMAVLTGNIGVVQWRLGQYAAALANYQLALEAVRTVGDAFKTAVWLGNIGLVHVDLQDDERALAYLNEALDMHDQLGRKYYKIELLLGKVKLFLRRGEVEQAAALHAEAADLSVRIGNRTYLLDCDLWQARLSVAQGHATEAIALLAALRAREFRPDVSAAITRELGQLLAATAPAPT